MAKDINIHIKTPGAAQAKQQLDEVGRSSKQVGDKTSQGARKGADGMDKLSQSATSTEGRFSKLTTGLKTWVTGLFGIMAVIAGITKAIQIQGEALKEHARIAAEQQKKLLALQAMGEFYKERPELRKEVAAYAEFGRRPFEDVAEAWYTLRSQAGRMTPEQRRGILKESLELGRMYPEAPLAELVNMFTLYAKATRAQDLNQVQNVLLQTITEAGGAMGAVSKFMPQFLGPAMAGGLTGAQAAGLWAYATTLPGAGGIEKASTALRNVLLILQGKGESPEAEKMLQRLGVTPGMGLFEQLAILTSQQRAGRFGLPQALLLAGRESATMLVDLLKDPKAMRETVSAVVQAGAGQRDITAETLKGLMTADKFARLEERSRQLDVIIQNIKGQDIKALEWDIYLKQYEKEMREAGVSEYMIQWQLRKYRIAAGFGAEPGPQWFMDPSKRLAPFFSPDLTKPFAEFPEAPLAEPGGGIVVHYHNDTIYNPRTGSDERGPRFTQD